MRTFNLQHEFFCAVTLLFPFDTSRLFPPQKGCIITSLARSPPPPIVLLYIYLSAAHSFKSNKWHSIHTARASGNVRITCENFNFDISLRRLLPPRRDRFVVTIHRRWPSQPPRDARSFLTPTNCQRLVKGKKYEWSAREFYHVGRFVTRRCGRCNSKIKKRSVCFKEMLLVT